MAASDSKQSLSLDEMLVADQAATLMITLLKGDGREVDLNDDRLQNLRTTCVVASFRLRVSMEKDNTRVVRELITQAQDVLEHVEAAMRVYVDMEIVANM